MRPKGLLSVKRVRRLRELMRDTKSAPVDGSTQRKGRARVIGTASPQAANIVLAYHDENARLRAEVERLRNACTHALTMLQSTGMDASWTVLSQRLADALAREDGVADE